MVKFKGQCQKLESHDLTFDHFHLGMSKYEWRYIPDPEGEVLRNPLDDWTLGNRFDHLCGRQTNQSNYEHNLMVWKTRPLEIIQGMNQVEFMVCKSKYKEIVDRKQHARNQQQHLLNRVGCVDGEISLPGVEKEHHQSSQALIMSTLEIAAHPVI
jgi:hypothetical protein